MIPVQELTRSLPSGPYSMGYSGNGGAHGHRYMVIYDATGRVIMSVFGKQEERLALAQLIVEASGGAPKPKEPS